jgi:hypothetical protein
MMLTVRNDQGLEFYHECQEFIGYDVFIEAREHWGYNWQTYIVLAGTEILESVINPDTLDPEQAQRIH